MRDRRGWVRPAALLGLLALVAALYVPSAAGPFLMDDYSNLLGNEALRIDRLDPQALVEAAVSRQSGPLRRPVAMLSFALNHYVSGELETWSIKLTNVAFHLITTALLFFLARRLLRHWLDPARAGWVALLVTALWALHPLHVSTVLYAVQRMTILAGLFMAAGLLCYVRGRERLLAGATGRGAAWVGVGLVGFGALALLSKENGALLPVLALVIEATVYRFACPAGEPRWVRPVLVAVLGVPTLVLVVALGVYWAGPLGDSPLRDFTATERLLTQARVLWFYVSELAFPDIGRMSLFHSGFAVSRGLLDPPTTLPALLALAAVLAGALWLVGRGRWPVLAFGVLFFLVGHALESTVIPLELVFEHRNYLPSFGLCLAAGYGLARLPLHRYVRGWVRGALFLALPLALASQLQLRAGYWSSISDFLTQELVHHPEAPRAWVTLAYAQVQAGFYEEAVDFYDKAAELEPDEVGHPVGAFSLRIHALDRPPDPARVGEIRERLRTGHPISHFGSGQLRRMAERFRETDNRDAPALRAATQILGAAVAVEAWPGPEHRAIAYFLLGELHLYQNEPRHAAQALQAGLKLSPQAHGVRTHLAELLVELGRVNAAREQLAHLEDKTLPDPVRRRVTRLRERLSE